MAELEKIVSILTTDDMKKTPHLRDIMNTIVTLIRYV